MAQPEDPLAAKEREVKQAGVDSVLAGAPPALPPLPPVGGCSRSRLPPMHELGACACSLAAAQPGAVTTRAGGAFIRSAVWSPSVAQRTSLRHVILQAEPFTDKLFRWLPEFVRDVVQVGWWG